MLTFAYLGNFSAPHSTENEVRKALEVLGHRVVQVQEGDTPPGDVPGIAASHRADLLLWTQTYGLATRHSREARAEMLDTLRANGVPSVGYHLDRWWGLPREDQVTPDPEPFFTCDVVCTADGGRDPDWRLAGVNHRWFPPAVSEFECEPGRWRENLAADVAFVGSWRYTFDDDGNQVAGYHPEWAHRRDLIAWLQQTYPQQLRLFPRGPAIRGQALRDVYASTKVNVGDSCLIAGATRYWSDRVPETLGRGGFLVHPWVEGMEEHYVDGQHLRVWPLGDWGELRRLIDHYARHDELRAKIAAEGRRHVLATATYTIRMRQLEQMLRDEGLL